MPELLFRQGVKRSFRRDAEVARQRQFESDAKAVSAIGDDHRLRATRRRGNVPGEALGLLIVIVPLIMIPLGYIVESGLIQRVFNKPDRHVTTLLLTFGLGLVLEEVLKVIFGPNTQRPPTPIPGAFDVFGIIMPNYRLS